MEITDMKIHITDMTWTLPYIRQVTLDFFRIGMENAKE